jgi:hypothetical protein
MQARCPTSSETQAPGSFVTSKPSIERAKPRPRLPSHSLNAKTEVDARDERPLPPAGQNSPCYFFLLSHVGMGRVYGSQFGVD